MSGVEIDKGLCIGSGTCEALDPAVFQVGDDGIAYLVDGATPDEALLREAAANCPSGAISVVSE
jgi:ferredoxin